MRTIRNMSLVVFLLALTSAPSVFARTDRWVPTGNVYDSYLQCWNAATFDCPTACGDVGMGWKGYGTDPWGVRCQNWTPYWLLDCLCGEPWPE